jgi:putative membrane protein
MKRLVITMTVAGSLWLNYAGAQNQPDTATTNFINQAATGGLKEVASGKLAVTKGSSPEVKRFGARMVTDHTSANEKLLSIVKAKAYPSPPAPTASDLNDPMLQQTSGNIFDKNYVMMMVNDHKKTVALFEHAADAVPDPDIKAFATQQLPTLKEHLAMITQIAAKYK